MEIYLSVLPGYMDDVRKYGFITDNNEILKSQTKVNLHYFKTTYASRIIKVIRGYFEDTYFS